MPVRCPFAATSGRRRRLRGWLRAGLLLPLLVSLPGGGAYWGAARAAEHEPGRIDIAYLAPKDPAHEPLYRLLKDKRILEKIQAILSPFRLPRRVLLKVEGCDGVSNAYSGNDAVTVCYEYLDEVWRNVPNDTTPEGVAPVDALAGPLVDVFFHEFGHVVFYLFQVPVFGREEDAADQFSAYLMLHFGPDEARRLIAGTAYQFKNDLKPEVTVQLKDFSDTHGAPAARFYNLLCIAFGANGDLFADVVRKGFLPVERAIGCEDEYHQLARAFKTLIMPHIDPTLAKRVMAKQWLPDGAARPPRRPEPDPR
ncbi:MAG TPA: DUF4344 domain-containing metallopeptidase [Hyphomicrobiaceae bacterium]|nr:DUF4344 domain-containing metallopeptidase [Hyphomicrobiaceae bacterium]